MSRITASDARGLLEAYNAVYASQEVFEEEVVAEEEVVEDVEQIDEQGRGRVTGSNPNVWKPTPSTSGPAGGGMGGRRGSGSNPSVPKSSAPAPTKPAAPAPAPTKPAASAPAPTKPAASLDTKVAPTKAATPRPGTKAAGPESIKPKTPNPLLKGGEIGAMIKRSQERQAATSQTTTPVNRATGSKKPGSAFESYDAYDLVLEYLLSNGHVETVDEAHYVMLEMEAEVIQDIVEEQKATWNKGQTLKDPRAQKIYDKMTGAKPVKLPPA